MKRRRLLLPAAFVLLATLAILLWPRTPKEPFHQGRPITQWIGDCFSVPSPQQREDTRAAVQAIGTNALPFLLHQFTRPLPGWRFRFNAWAARYLPFRIHLDDDRQLRVILAATGLRILGTNAASVLPAIVPHLGDPHRSDHVVFILRDVGDASIPYLVAALDSPSGLAVSNAVATLQPFAYRPGPGRDALAAALRHPRAEVRAHAAKSWTIAAGPTAVPALLPLLHDASPFVVQAASNQLARLTRNRLTTYSLFIAASNALLTLRTNLPP